MGTLRATRQIHPRRWRAGPVVRWVVVRNPRERGIVDGLGVRHGAVLALVIHIRTHRRLSRVLASATRASVEVLHLSHYVLSQDGRGEGCKKVLGELNRLLSRKSSQVKKLATRMNMKCAVACDWTLIEGHYE